MALDQPRLDPRPAGTALQAVPAGTAPHREEAMITVKNLTKFYEPKGAGSTRRWPRREAPKDDRRPAVDDVSFEVARGELYIIMGLSGSGKSTVLRMLNRLVEPTSGTVLVDGTDVGSAAPKDLRRVRNQTVNMVFQHFAIFPHRTVLENAAYGLQVRGVDMKERTARATEALERVGLGDWAHSLPSALSGGMRQRVGLARALATDAEVLLMDEPYSALDPLIRRDMQDLLLELQQQLRKTIVFVTHDLNEAMRLGDRIMVMRDGRIVQIGTGSEILAKPADDYVAEFVSDVDRARVVTAGTIMRDPLTTVRPATPPAEALERVANAEAHGTYVVDEVGVLLGAISAEALLAAAGRGAASVGELDLSAYKTVHQDARLMELFPLVGKCCVPLGVVDGAGRLVGVISRAQLLKALEGEGSKTHA